MLLSGQARKIASIPEDPDILDEFSLRCSSMPSAGKARIRRYRPGDQEAVRRICCDTGFLGSPIDIIFQDRELFADLLAGPYLEYEPEWALVAETEGRVVGYLLGSVSRHFNRRVVGSGFRTARKMLTKLLTGKYVGHPRSEQFVRWVWTVGLLERPRHPANAAHLHFNLESPYRGRSIGKRIWLAYEKMLRAANIDQYYGEFFSYPGRHPEQIYARFGFIEYDRCQTTLFRPEIPDPVHVVCVCKTLNARGTSTGYLKGER